MNSSDRHELRYQRRKAERDAKLAEVGGKSFDEVVNFENLCEAGKKSCNGSRWKSSTINFETFLLRDCYNMLLKLQCGDRKFKSFHSFKVIEHGKERNIDALPIQERMAQKCLCNNLLTAAYSRSFVYDNSASLKNKGMDFAIKRLKKHLSDHYRKHGLEGGVYQFDFKNYFGSIPHEEIKRRARRIILDDKLYELFCSYVDDFQKLGKADRNDIIKHGVGLGSEVSQIIALDFASPIDHYIKDVLGIKGYGRYMDDGYIIHHSIDFLKEVKKCLYELAEDIGLKMSDKKNIITPLKNHSFVFLKMRITLTKSGKVVFKLSKKSIKSMRRRLKIFRRWVDEGRMYPEDAFASYQSWRAHARRCNSYETLEGMDLYFVDLFHDELEARKLRFPCTLLPIRTEMGWKYRQRGLPTERRGTIIWTQ